CGVAGTANLPHAVPFFETGFGFFRIEVPLRVDKLRGLLVPDAHHLCGLLFQRHALEQIFDALFGRQSGIFVSGRSRLGCTARWLGSFTGRAALQRQGGTHRMDFDWVCRWMNRRCVCAKTAPPAPSKRNYTKPVLIAAKRNRTRRVTGSPQNSFLATQTML